ncbi:hypothetical protein ACQPW3_10700 [Actinosynnema sp. CA-248983]
MSFQMILTEAQKEHLRTYLRRCVADVEAHLRAGDLDGANAYMDDVLAKAGQGAHDLVLDTMARLRGQPRWRTYIPRRTYR